MTLRHAIRVCKRFSLTHASRRPANAAAVRLFGTDLLTVRIDLDG
jgi:hypothetical protein